MSLLLPGDARFAGQLAQSLSAAGQEVPPQLSELAMRVRQGHCRTERLLLIRGFGSTLAHMVPLVPVLRLRNSFMQSFLPTGSFQQ